MRVITLDSNKKVTDTKTVNDDYTNNPGLQPGEIISDIGEMGQIQQTDDSFISPPPPQPTLQDVQTAKSNEIYVSYNNALAAGFTSAASGTEKNYIYNDEAQKDFSDLFLLKANGVLTYPVTVYSSAGESIQLAETQLTQMMADIATFKLGLSNKKHDYLVQVQTATTVDEVNAIVVAF